MAVGVEVAVGVLVKVGVNVGVGVELRVGVAVRVGVRVVEGIGVALGRRDEVGLAVGEIFCDSEQARLRLPRIKAKVMNINLEDSARCKDIIIGSSDLYWLTNIGLIGAVEYASTSPI